jgi:hypothetical protein
LLFLLGCGATPSASGGSTGEAEASTSEGGPPEVSATSEAATSEAATGEGTAPAPASFTACRALVVNCEAGAPPPACSFPEGTCACEIHYRCSGVPPGPGEPNAWRAWTCRETPPAFLPNGCPGTEPEDGAPCDGRAAHCEYGDCAFVPYECVGGVWRRGMASAPP